MMGKVKKMMMILMVAALALGAAVSVSAAAKTRPAAPEKVTVSAKVTKKNKTACTAVKKETISWKKTSGAKGYRIYRRKWDGIHEGKYSNWELVTIVKDVKTISKVITRKVKYFSGPVLGGLIPKVQYAVASYNAKGESAKKKCSKWLNENCYQ